MKSNLSNHANKRVLIIDDEQNVLQGLRRRLHGKFDLALAANGKEGMLKAEQSGPFAVVVCDMNMPGQSGIEVLGNFAAKCPETVRIMLTGQADLNTAMDAVNEGNIFRFFTKPCPAEKLITALDAGIEQYRLVTAERELLHKTLAGSIKVLTDILSIIDPESFGRTERARSLCGPIAEAVGLKGDSWKLETAIMLAPIGFASLPADIAKKARQGNNLSIAEEEMVYSTSETAHKLICNIPRLDEVASYIKYQSKNFDGTGTPRGESIAGLDIPIGARIIRILNDADLGINNGNIDKKLTEMMMASEKYDIDIIEKIKPVLLENLILNNKKIIKEVKINEIQIGDVLKDSIMDTKHGQLILSSGSVISEIYLNRLMNLNKIKELSKKITVIRNAA